MKHESSTIALKDLPSKKLGILVMWYKS